MSLMVLRMYMIPSDVPVSQSRSPTAIGFVAMPYTAVLLRHTLLYMMTHDMNVPYRCQIVSCNDDDTVRIWDDRPALLVLC